MVAGRWWAWNLLSFLPPIVILGVPAIGVVWALSIRSWRASLLLAMAAALGWTHADIHLAAHPRPISSASVVVLNWNTRFWNEEHDPDFYGFLVRQNADVYQLQEYWDRDGKPLERSAELKAAFPGYALATSGDQVTLSRFPIIAHTGTAADHYLRTDVDVNGTRVSFYNVHISMQMNPNMRGVFYQRQHELRSLEADLGANAAPTVVTGDFNSTTAMGVLAWFFARYQDAADAGSSLLPRTWALHLLPNLRLWRIDFAFLDRRLAVSTYENFEGASSDHLAQRITFAAPRA